MLDRLAAGRGVGDLADHITLAFTSGITGSALDAAVGDLADHALAGVAGWTPPLIGPDPAAIAAAMGIDLCTLVEGLVAVLRDNAARMAGEAGPEAEATAMAEAQEEAAERARLMAARIRALAGVIAALVARARALPAPTPIAILATTLSPTSGAPPGHAREARPAPRRVTTLCRTASRRGAGHHGPPAHPAGPSGPYISPI